MKLPWLALIAGAAFGQAVPAWVRTEAARSVPAYPPKVSSVVLFQEEQLTVAPDGRRTMRERGAVRILQVSRENVSVWRSYNTKTGRIRDFRVWLLQPGGREQQFKPEEVLDVALSRQYTYDESRAKTLQCPSTAPAGSIFAWEIVEEEKTIFTQYLYDFQGRMPVLTSRFVLSLPPGWEQRDVTFNRAAVAPAVTGSTYTWELRDLPWIEYEEYSPGLGSLVPRLGVTCFPPSDNSAGLPAIKNWEAVGEWLSGLMEPSAEADASIRARAAALIAGAATPIDKIRAIAASVQKINYVSVQMNLTRGGGYTPHAAAQVLSRSYGDCKDKAALMKSLLTAAGIESHIALVYSGNRRHVRPEWASSLQFNHAIVAIRVDASVTSGAAAEYPRLGRLLWFDPTDPYTPLGELPSDEQGSQLLVLSGGKGELVMAPLLGPVAHRVDSEIEATLDAGGLLKAKLHRRYSGQPAAAIRSTLAQEGLDELRRSFEGSFAQRMGGITLGKLEPVDREGEPVQVKVDYEVAKFGQLQASLVLMRPGTLVPGTRYAFVEKERKLPIRLSASLRQDRIAIQLPDRLKVDEMPDPASLKTPYGTYRASYRSEGGKLLFEQTLETPDAMVPAEEYAKVRDFFEKVGGYQQAVVVLAK